MFSDLLLLISRITESLYISRLSTLLFDMIDTVILRIYDLREHEPLVRFLHKEHIKGISTKAAEKEHGFDPTKLLEKLTHELETLNPDPENLKRLHDEMKLAYEHSQLHWQRRFNIQRYATDQSNGKHWEQMYRNFLRSSNYDINYCINFQQDWMELNFSIPKYLYVTNVFQFVPHYFDDDYKNVFDSSFDVMKSITFKRFKKFIKWFFEKEFGGLVNLYNVHLMRMDLCFNKIFDSKEDALRYLFDLKRIKKKYLRDNTEKINNYHSGIYYPTRDYTFKVYHKGSEFRNNDAKEIKKLVSKYEMQKLQEYSDRVLRYELEFRTRYMDKLFKKYIFRREDKRWRRGLKFYNQVCDSGFATIDGKKVHVLSMIKKDRNDYEYGKFYANKVFQFFLESDSGFFKDSEFWDLEIKTREFSFEREQRFSGKLFAKMLDVFKIFYNEFSVSYTNDIVSMVSEIDMSSSDDKERSLRIANALRLQLGEFPKWCRDIRFAKVKLFLELLKTHSFSEIQESKLFPERTFFTYKRFFKSFGLNDFSSQLVIPHSKMNFKTYYDYVEHEFSRLDFTKLFYRPF